MTARIQYISVGATNLAISVCPVYQLVVTTSGSGLFTKLCDFLPIWSLPHWICINTTAPTRTIYILCSWVVFARALYWSQCHFRMAHEERVWVPCTGKTMNWWYSGHYLTMYPSRVSFSWHLIFASTFMWRDYGGMLYTARELPRMYHHGESALWECNVLQHLLWLASLPGSPSWSILAVIFPGETESFIWFYGSCPATRLWHRDGFSHVTASVDVRLAMLG